MLGASLEDYLETILILNQKNGHARSIDVARYLNFSKASVSHAVKLLGKKGYIVREINGNLSLTEAGYAAALQLYERRNYFKNFLIQAGVDVALAEQDACNLEHAISSESFNKVKVAYRLK